MAHTVLVVDDDRDLTRILKRLLERKRYCVIEAWSGRGALKTVDEAKPDLLVLDVMMPDLDGWAVCQSLREGSDLPIILLSARNGVEDIVRGLKSGADDVMSKPFHGAELEARIQALLRRRHGAGVWWLNPQGI